MKEYVTSLLDKKIQYNGDIVGEYITSLCW